MTRMHQALRWLNYQRTIGPVGFRLLLIAAALGAAYCIIEHRFYHAALVLTLTLIFAERR